MKTISKSIIAIMLAITAISCQSQIDLIDNKISNYKIVIPSNATDVEIKSAEELQKYLFEVSDVKLDIITDDKSKILNEINIGNTNRVQEIGADINLLSLEEDGYKIITLGDDLYILGGRKKGTLYGVYTFIEEYLGVKMYTPNVIEIPKLEKVSIPQLDITEIPIIKYRELHIPFARKSQEYCDWYKLHHPSVRAKEYGSFVHTFERLVPSDIYFQDHPQYFSEINGIRIPNQQLCLSNPELYQTLLNNLKKQMEEKPEAIVWDVSQNDNFGNCTCSSCSKADSTYGSPSGLMIEFVNKIAREFPNKTISTLAYQYTRKAPLGIIPEPNVMVVLCTIECDRSRPIKENKDDLFNRDIQEWSKLTDNIKIWDYVVQFASYTNPFPNFHVLKPNIKLFVDHGVKSLFEQGSGDSWSDMHELKAYVLAKLMWNPDANVEKLIQEFIDGYYGSASNHIQQYFSTRQDAVVNSNEGLIIYGYPRTGVSSYLKPELLVKYSELFDKAEMAVSDKHNYLKRVRSARIPLEYAILEISKLNINDDLKIFNPIGNSVEINPKMEERLKFFVENANIAGIERLNERGISPDEYNMLMQKYFNDGMVIHKGYKKNVQILSNIHPNYTANGSATLSDGINGEANYFFNWLGFEAEEFEAIVDLEKNTEIESIRTNFLQEVKSWIWLPKSVEYYISNDGENYKIIGVVKKKADETKRGIFTESFLLNVNNLKAKYVKVKTNSLINCPVWHIGHNHGNGKAFIFIDEIIIQ